MRKERNQNAWRGRSRLQLSVRLLLVLSLIGATACVTQPVVIDGCIGQSDAVLEEIASGSLDHYNPATAAWEREVYRVCSDE